MRRLSFGILKLMVLIREFCLTCLAFELEADHLNRTRRTYTIYIAYAPYYRTPRLYLSGYLANSQPLPPQLMMEDIVGDYKDKTVTLEDFPYFSNNIKMASIHPCKHASVMKTLLDRADAALKIRREKLKAGKILPGAKDAGMEGLVDDFGKTGIDDKKAMIEGMKAGGNGNDEWEVLQHDVAATPDEEVAIRVDQYLVVFLKVSHRYPMFVLLTKKTVHGKRYTRNRARFHHGGVDHHESYNCLLFSITDWDIGTGQVMLRSSGR
jgi:hypothetical protein